MLKHETLIQFSVLLFAFGFLGDEHQWLKNKLGKIKVNTNGQLIIQVAFLRDILSCESLVLQGKA